MPVPTHRKGLLAIAVFEAIKGAGGVIAGIVALGFMDRDNEVFAEQIIRRLHIDPTWHYAQGFVKVMAEASDSQIMVVAAFFALYAAVRFAEAYGLWQGRRWAEWFAALSGAIYIPIELYELLHRITWLKVTFLGVNVAVVAYMVWLLTEARRLRAKQASADTIP